MGIVPNRAYNDENLGRAFTSIAGMFAPPDSGELVNYAQAAELRQKNGIIENLKSDPRYSGADAAVLAGLYNPTQSWQALDMNDATARRGQDITAQTDIQKTLLAPVSKDQTRFVPPSLADQFGLPEMQLGNIGAAQGERITTPDGRLIEGVPKPMSETEVKGGWLQDLLDSGKLSQDDVATQYRSDTNIEEVIGADGKPVIASRAAAIGMTPVPTAPSTSVTVGAGEKSFDVETGKLFAQQYSQINGQAAVAQDMLSLLGAAEGALASGVYTGLGGDQLLDLQRLGTALGVDNAEQVAGGELVRAIQNRMALLMRNPESGMGMPGAVSDRDLTFLKAAQPGLGRTPEGNSQLLGMLAAMERRKIEIANLADTYVQENGRLDVGFNQKVREYAKANPLFPDPASAGGNTGGAGADASGDVYAVNPHTGERLVYRDGQWQAAE